MIFYNICDKPSSIQLKIYIIINHEFVLINEIDNHITLLSVDKKYTRMIFFYFILFLVIGIRKWILWTKNYDKREKEKERNKKQ